MRVLICGGRYYDDGEAVHRELIRFNARSPISVVIHGGVSGAGALAEAWARRNGVAVVRYPPNWERFRKRAEKIRNDFMLADCRADCVIAFPGGSNTADLVAKALADGIPVLYAPLCEVVRTYAARAPGTLDLIRAGGEPPTHSD